jgi:hypothetical protein
MTPGPNGEGTVAKLCAQPDPGMLPAIQRFSEDCRLDDGF